MATYISDILESSHSQARLIVETGELKSNRTIDATYKLEIKADRDFEICEPNYNYVWIYTSNGETFFGNYLSNRSRPNITCNNKNANTWYMIHEGSCNINYYVDGTAYIEADLDIRLYPIGHTNWSDDFDRIDDEILIKLNPIDPIICNIEFSANDLDVSNLSYQLPAGSFINELPTLTKCATGAVKFNGWSDTPFKGVSHFDKEPHPIISCPYKTVPNWSQEDVGTPTITFYAVWTDTYIKLNYCSNYADRVRNYYIDLGNFSIYELDSTQNIVVLSECKHYFWYSEQGVPDYGGASESATLILHRDGYEPTGYWGTEPDGGIVFHENKPFTGKQLAELLGIDISSQNAEINLYPQWRPLNVRVSKTDGKIYANDFIVSDKTYIDKKANLYAPAFLQGEKLEIGNKGITATDFIKGSPLFPYNYFELQ